MNAWRGDSAAHAAAGRKGGLKNSKRRNKTNFANDRKRASDVGRKGAEAKWKNDGIHLTSVTKEAVNVDEDGKL